MIYVLHLDDDKDLLADVRTALEEAGLSVFSAPNVDVAADIVTGHKINFAVVDLFLEGDDGEELSNDFIRNILMPRGIPFGRMTSAPGLVGEDVAGRWILPKGVFRRAPHTLAALIRKTVDVA